MSILIPAIVPARGPAPDIKYFRPLLDQGLRQTPIEAVALDVGYDAEHTHEYARFERGVRTFIMQLIGRRTGKSPRGYRRRQMAQRLHLTRYTQRWQAEMVNGMAQAADGLCLACA